MKALAVIGGALATAVVATGVLVGPAFAQPPAPNSGCGAALLALTQADKAAADADAADKAAADAKKADDAQADADAVVDTARTAAVNGGASTTDLADNGGVLRARKAALLAITTPPGRTAAEEDELIKIGPKLALVDAFTAAQTKAAAAKVVADKSDAEALRREADKTDAAALVAAAGKAGDAADRACGSGNGVRFENCDAVRAAGKAPLRFDQPGYRVGLDRNRNGIACEDTDNSVTPTPRPVPVPSAINTGKPLQR